MLVQKTILLQQDLQKQMHSLPLQPKFLQNVRPTTQEFLIKFPETLTQVFPVNFTKFLRTLFSYTKLLMAFQDFIQFDLCRLCVNKLLTNM